jgi:hypothetical protein
MVDIGHIDGDVLIMIIIIIIIKSLIQLIYIVALHLPN